MCSGRDGLDWPTGGRSGPCSEDLDLRSAVSRSSAGNYASASKPDAPSGTARELAGRLAGVNATTLDVPVDQTGGQVEARGATVAGTQLHSLRLPSFVVSTEVVFALPDERLVIRHDAGPTPTPYVAATLLAIRAAPRSTGLVRGLDTLLLDRQMGPGERPARSMAAPFA